MKNVNTVPPRSILQYATKNLRGEALVVFIHLVSYFDYTNNTGFVYPGKKRVAEELSMDRHNVNRALRTLEHGGHIKYVEAVETARGVKSGWYITKFSTPMFDTELYNTSEQSGVTPTRRGVTPTRRGVTPTRRGVTPTPIYNIDKIRDMKSDIFLRQGAAKSYDWKETDGNSTQNNKNDLTVTLPKPCCTPEITGVESEKTEMNVGKPRRGPGDYEEPASGNQTPQPSRSALTQRKASQKLYQDCRSLILHITQYTHVGPDFYADPPQMSTWKSIIKIHGLDDAKWYADSLLRSPRHKAEFITQALPFAAKTLERFIRTHGPALKTGQMAKESMISLDNWEGDVAD